MIEIMQAISEVGAGSSITNDSIVSLESTEIMQPVISEAREGSSLTIDSTQAISEASAGSSITIDSIVNPGSTEIMQAVSETGANFSITIDSTVNPGSTEIMQAISEASTGSFITIDSTVNYPGSKEIMQVVSEAGAGSSITNSSTVNPGSTDQSEPCIFKVHSPLRNVNDKAYEPEIIAIGPYHRKKPHLQMMKAHKSRFQDLLLRRNGENLSTYLDAIKPLAKTAMNCYAEKTELPLDDEKFVKMMVLDGCFIIELLRKFKEFKSPADVNGPEHENTQNDPLFKMPWALNFLQRDLMLFENQLPFFILLKLYYMIEPSGTQDKLRELALEFFNDLLPGHGKERKINTRAPTQEGITHLLELIHMNWSSQKVQPDPNVTCNMDNLELIRNCTELAEAGIKFKKVVNGVSFDIEFENKGLLWIPILTIEGRTESFIRNLIAYEQYCGRKDSQFNIVTDYMTFWSCLIKSNEDVTRLSRRGVVHSFLGDNEALCRMFSTMNDCITGPSTKFHYGDIFIRVNKHCDGHVNRWMVKLRRKYMHSPWGIISICVAGSVLVLALLEVIFQILSWKKKN